MGENFKRELVYLAVPYSHRSANVREMRFREANRISAGLMDAGILIFSPISHTHPIALAGKLPLGWDFWERYDRAYLVVCRALVVLRLNGWQESKGVAAECRIMDEMGKPVHYLDPYNADQFRRLVTVLSKENSLVSNKVIQRVTEGWGQPAGAQRFHYFRESRSLCMVWFFTGSLQADDGIIGSCDCRKCLRALKKTQPAPR